jgi:hypothetical protein
MSNEEGGYWTSIAVWSTTRDRIVTFKQRIGPRKRLETLEDVVIRALDALEEKERVSE